MDFAFFPKYNSLFKFYLFLNAEDHNDIFGVVLTKFLTRRFHKVDPRTSHYETTRRLPKASPLIHWSLELRSL